METPLEYATIEGFIDVGDAVPLAPTSRAPVSRWRQMLEVFVQNQLADRLHDRARDHRGRLLSRSALLRDEPDQREPDPPRAEEPAAQTRRTWLGTDNQGWDVLGRIMYAGQYSLTLGFFAGFITIVVGTTYGMISGFFGGVTDTVMMRIIDAFLSIPYLFLLDHPASRSSTTRRRS